MFTPRVTAIKREAQYHIFPNIKKMGFRAIHQSENMERKLKTGNQSQNFDNIREIWLPWWGKVLLSDYRRKRVVLALGRWAT